MFINWNIISRPLAVTIDNTIELLLVTIYTLLAGTDSGGERLEFKAPSYIFFAARGD